MRKLLLLLFIIGAVLFCTVRIPAQTAGGTVQVSPVANLQGSNASVVNNNFQYLQNGVNAALYLIQQYFPGGILQGNMGGTGLNSTNVASGDTLVTSNGIWTVIPYSNHGSQIFTTSGTFTAPSGVSMVYLTVEAAGGAGGANGNDGVDGNGDGGGGGNSGNYVIDYPYPVTANNSYTVTVGTSSGSNSVFDALTISGGGNGCTGNGNSGNCSSSPNSGTNFQFTGITGSNGGSGQGSSGGAGASSQIGTGGAGGPSNSGSGNVGGVGTGYGSGGGGAGGTSNGSYNPQSGGNGAPGIVIVKW